MAVITSYETAASHFSSVRYKLKGKPLCSMGRLYKRYEPCSDVMLKRMGIEREYFDIHIHGQHLCSLTSDNVLTFVMPKNLVKHNAITLAVSLDNMVNVFWSRFATGRWKLWCYDPEDYSYNYNKMLDAPEYFEGIKFNLVTKECLNPQASDVGHVNVANRKVWWNAIRAWKRGVRVRAKMGMFSELVDKAVNEQQPSGPYVNFHGEKELDTLARCIKNNEHPTELFMMFIHSHLRRHMYAPQGDMKTMFVSQAIDTVCNEQSVELRRRFGVFDDV